MHGPVVRLRLMLVMACVGLCLAGWAAPARALAQGGTVVKAVDDDPENRLLNCAEPGYRVPFGNEEVDKGRCFTFRYQVPPGGITSATLHMTIKTLGGDQGTDALTLAVGQRFDEYVWSEGQMRGAVGLHGGFVGGEPRLDFDLFNLACDPTVSSVINEPMQAAVIDQLNTGVMHFLLQDDTALYSAEMVLNGDPLVGPCGQSATGSGAASGVATPAPGAGGPVMGGAGAAGGVSGPGPFRPADLLAPELTTHIPTPLDISTDPAVVGSNLLLAALAMLAFTAASEVLNRTLAEHETELQRFLAPLRRLGGIFGRLSAAVRARLGRPSALDWVKLALLLVVYGIVLSLLDVTWDPLTVTGIWLLGGMILAVGLAGLGDDVAQWRAARGRGLATDLGLRPANLLLVMASAAISRTFLLVPGIMFGMPEAFEIDRERLDGRTDAYLQRVSAATIAGVGLGAWALTAFTALVLRIAGLPRLLAVPIGGVQSCLLLVYAVALQSAFLQMLGLADSVGLALRRRSRVLWMIALVLVTFVFLHTLLNPQGDLARALATTNIQFFLATVGVFVLATAAVWLYFRNRKPAAPAGVAPAGMATAPGAGAVAAPPGAVAPAGYCTECGAALRPGARFCMRCGHPTG